jgi:Zn-dependent protease with chaperone function
VQGTDEVTNCPDCGHQIRVDRRYVTWCDKCDWNLDPTPLNDPTPAWRLKLEHRLAESLYRELESGAVHRPGWDAARVAAHLLSALILLIPLLGFLTGTALLIFYRPLWFSALLALLAFAMAFAFRPRAADLPEDVHLVHRDQAPTLYAVLDELATAIGTRKVAAVAVSAEANLWYQQIGWRFRPVIGIGLPLWAGLRPQERIAILAHELGHGRHGDARSGWLVSSAWSVLEGLRLRSGQRAEYLADRKAGEIAGSEAAVHALERLLLADASSRAMERALRFPTEIEPLEAVRRAVTEVPAREIERHVRASRTRETRTDSTHPPTYLRTRLLRTRPATSAQVVLGTDKSRAIDQELAPAAQKVLHELRGEL